MSTSSLNEKLYFITETLFLVRCLRCVVVARMSTKHEALILRFWDIKGPSSSIKSFEQHSRWQHVVPSIANPFNWRVRWPRPVRIPLISQGLEVLGVACGHSGRLLTHYRPREVRNSIYQYRKIHIDYRSKVSYRFISTISIIYGNTSNDVSRTISGSKGQRSRSHGSFEVFAVSAPWLRCYWTDSLHLWYTHNPWGDNVSRTISGSKGQGHTGRLKFLPCSLRGSWYTHSPMNIYNQGGDNASCNISRSKGRSSMSHRSFTCKLWAFGG